MRKTSKPITSSQFDDALPERLLGLAPNDQLSSKVRLHHGESELSPFIVKLTRGADTALVLAGPQEDPIAALARSFIIEHDDVLDEAPLMVARASEDGLRLTVEDLKEQMRESECDLAPMPARPLGERVRRSLMDEAVPIDIWSEVQPIDIVEAFHVVPETPVAAFVIADIAEDEDEATQTHEVVPVQWSEPKVAVYVRQGNGWQRALASFVGLALAAVLPLHALQVLADVREDGGVVEAESKAALDTFLRGATSLSSEEFGSAGEEFAQAAQGFAEAESSLNDLNAGVTALASVIPQTDRTVDSVRALVTAGRELSETAAVMSSAANDLSDKDSIDLTSKLSLLGAYMENALPHAQIAATALREVDPTVVPESYAEAVVELQTRTPQLVTSMEEYIGFVDALSFMLGGEEKMRYLAVFQNNTELRPTGGFLGSFAEMDVERGEVVRMFVPGGGTYDVQGQLKAFVAAPGPLQLLKARWEFQDANWFPDFPSSAKKLSWFYSAAGGPTTDGVVAVNATFVAELLRLLGPVEMPEYGRTFDAENFIFETQKIVELEYDKDENAPKEIIGDLAPILLERIKDADVQTLLAVVDLVAKGLQEKDIQLNFRDNDLQATIEDFGWSGSMKQTSGDYLMLVNTNLGGGKTDAVIDQDIHVDVRVAEDGSVENKVTITKTHRGMKNALFTGSNNVDYLRLYVPKGSVLLAADGFETPEDDLFETSDLPLGIDEDLELHMQDLKKDPATGTDIWNEDGKTVFGNWMQTASGEVEIVTFTYSVPLTLFTDPEDQGFFDLAKSKLGAPDLGRYTMLLQKQSGVQSRTTTVNITLPANVQPLWSSTGKADNLHFVSDNATDSFAGWLLERD
ncbi:MAG: DUF4012 domain-containing protein [Patescibacteria group bacterium]